MWVIEALEMKIEVKRCKLIEKLFSRGVERHTKA
jgi:hypothetical protein